MATCASCESILPQSAGQCPVCGSSPGISADDFLAELAPDAPEAHSAGVDPSPGVTAAGFVAPNGRVFTPPPLDDRLDDSHKSASPNTASSNTVTPNTVTPNTVTPNTVTPNTVTPNTVTPNTVTPNTVHASSLGTASGRPRRSRPSRSEFPSTLDTGDNPDFAAELGYGPGSMARTVRAISNRIDADIQVGPRRFHHVFATAAPLAAVCLVVLGTFGAYQVMDLERPISNESAETGPKPGTLAFTEAQSQAAADQAGAITSQVQEITGLDCGVPISANAISMSPTRLLTTASAVANETNPVVRFTDGTTRIGSVIGTDIRTDIAVIEVSDVEGVGELDWGSVDLIVDESNREIVVVERFGTAVSGTPATVGDIEGWVGTLLGFDFSGSAFRPGSAVLNNRGHVIGMVDETGRSAIGSSQLSAALGRVLARPSGHGEDCPAVDIEDDTTADEDVAD